MMILCLLLRLILTMELTFVQRCWRTPCSVVDQFTSGVNVERWTNRRVLTGCLRRSLLRIRLLKKASANVYILSSCGSCSELPYTAIFVWMDSDESCSVSTLNRRSWRLGFCPWPAARFSGAASEIPRDTVYTNYGRGVDELHWLVHSA